jgi:2-polyprenyl-3-methyl-5-hydroxy-6-metoxy-1,4-benzoquinol methylase
MQGKIDIECPVCHSKNKKKIWGKYTALQSAAYFCPPSRDKNRNKRFEDCIRKLWNGDEAQVLECVDCNFAFGYPYFGGDEEFYSISTETKGYGKWKWDYNYAIENLLPQKEKVKILDIGAGDGMFLDRIGNNYEKYALEGSEITRNTLKGKGIKVFDSFQAAIETHADAFDVIVMFQVLEHISQFSEFLTSISKLLNSNGILLISVPNISSVFEQERLFKGMDMIPNHINKWSEKSLDIALKKSDLSTVHIAYHPFSILGELPSLLHGYQKVQAINDNSLANKAYSIRNRTARIIALSLLSVPAIFKLLPLLLLHRKSPNILVKAKKCSNTYN